MRTGRGFCSCTRGYLYSITRGNSTFAGVILDKLPTDKHRQTLIISQLLWAGPGVMHEMNIGVCVCVCACVRACVRVCVNAKECRIW